jgi:hypothetical protein
MRLPWVLAVIFFIFFLLFVPTYENGRGKKRARDPQYNPFAPSLSDPINALPRSTRGKAAEKYEPDEQLRDQSSKRLRVWNPDVTEAGSFHDPEADIDPAELILIERKWHAVLEFTLLQCQGMSTNQALDEIGAKWGVGTGRNVRYLASMVDERGSLMRKEGSGSPKSVVSRKDIQDYFREQAEEWEFIFTYEAMALALKEKFDVGSTKTVKFLMDFMEWRKSRKSVKPFLTEAHMEARLEHASEWVNVDFFDEDDVVVHIDEKCFYAFDRRGKVVYLPPDVDGVSFHALSKTQIPYVMFLGAVAAPRPQKRIRWEDWTLSCWGN